MKRYRIVAISILAATIFGGAVIALADDTNTVVQTGRAFHPDEITINRGATVNFANQDEFIHQIYVDSQGFNYDSEEQEPGETLHITFPTAGTYPIRCHIHPKMLLTVHVK